MPAFSLPMPPRLACRRRFSGMGMLSYQSGLTAEFHSFGGWLEPRYIIGARALDQ